MQRTVVYKLKPTVAQATGLQRYLRVTRELYNAALEQRIGAYRQTGRGRSWTAQSREIKELREAGLLDGCHVHACQLSLRRLERAYERFFERCRTGVRRKGFPRFKGIENCRAFDRARKRLTREQRVLARKRKGSRRRAKQVTRVAREHLKVARVRRDFLHKQSRKLAEGYAFVAVEDLAVTAMSASATGNTQKPGKNVRQKAGLNRGILDASWGELLELLQYKLAERGGGLVRVNAHGTSQECSRCRAWVPKPLSQRRHQCPRCGLSLHRDQQRGAQHPPPGMGSARRRGSVRRWPTGPRGRR